MACGRGTVCGLAGGDKSKTRVAGGVIIFVVDFGWLALPASVTGTESNFLSNHVRRQTSGAPHLECVSA